MAKSNWLLQTLLALIFLVPAWLTITFFNKNFNVRGEVFMIWYQLGIIISAIIYLLGSTFSAAVLFPRSSILVGIILIGLTLGALSNILIFSAVAQAPNPGLPIAISGTASVFVFFCSLMLGKFWPRYFTVTQFNPYHFIGILLAIAGVMLITLKK